MKHNDYRRRRHEPWYPHLRLMIADAPMPVDERSIATRIDELHEALNVLAEAGKWSELATAMKERDALLSRVGPDERPEIFKAAARSNDRILELVRSGRQTVGDELVALRRRHDAIGNYESHRS